MITKLAIIDLDGVIVNNKRREQLARDVAQGLQSETWKKVFWENLFNPAFVALDEPIEGAAEGILLLEEKNFIIIYLTSRPETMRGATEAWLEQHQLQGANDGRAWRQLVMKDYETERWIKTDEWKAKKVHWLHTTILPEKTLFIDDQAENRAKVQGLIIAQEKKVLTCDSLRTVRMIYSKIKQSREEEAFNAS